MERHGTARIEPLPCGDLDVPDGGLPLMRGNFVPVGWGGLGDGGNTYVHSMGWFRDALYVGLTRNALCGGRPYERSQEYDVYPVKVPDIPWDLDWRAQIWRYAPAAARWEQVHASPMCPGNKGFPVPRHYGFRDMAVFQGASDPAPALYTASWGSHMGSGPFVLRCLDGVHFEEAAPDDRALFGTQTLRALVAFKGKLFTCPVGRCGVADTTHDEMIVLASDDPARGRWRKVSESFFGDPSNVTVFDLAVSNGFLYAGTMNPHQGYQVWKTDGEGEPPYRWTRVVSHGAWRGPLNEVALSLCDFDGRLYVGSGIYNCGYDRIYKVGPGAPELIRIDPDDRWELVMGEARATPDGLKVPLSGVGPGFNDPFAGYLWRQCVHDGWLYAGTCAWSSWLPFVRFENLPERVRRLFDPARFRRLLHDTGGFDLWRSRDGVRWAPVTVNGFGNPFNCGVRTMVSTPRGLFVGTVNQFGPEVAVPRKAGWRYEPNARGGVEVWLGTREPHPTEVTLVPLEREATRRALPLIRAQRPSTGDIVHDFYAGTGWRHVGFWTIDTADAAAACANLMDELLAFCWPEPPLKAPCYPTDEQLADWLARRAAGEQPPAPVRRREDVLDVGCREGASTAHLLRWFEPDGIVGVGDDPEALRRCRERFPAVRFVRAKLPRLALPAAAFDRVVAAEMLGRPARDGRLLRECLRVLRPGGQLVASGFRVAGIDDLEAGPGQEIGRLTALLARVGFTDLRVLDATRECAESYRNHAAAFFRKKWVDWEAEEDEIDAARRALPGGGEPMVAYVLISARRPER